MDKPGTISFIDIHSHKNDDEANIIRIHNLMVHEYSDELILTGKYYSLGVHPWYIDKSQQLPQKELFDRKEIIAIGETGLDKLRGPDLEIQERVFRHHIGISELLSKPLIIHNVRMTEQIIRIYKDVNPKMPWILHGFTGNSDQAKQSLMHNIYFSFSERGLKSQKSIDAFRIIPLERVFMETDEGEMGIEILYHEYCDLYNLENNDVSGRVMRNFQIAFQPDGFQPI